MQHVAPVDEVKMWRRAQNAAHRTFNLKCAHISAALANGERVAPFVRDFLRSPTCRFSASLRVSGAKPTRSATESIQRAMFPPEGSSHLVEWFPRRKRSGGTRPICVLSPAMRAEHIMVAEVLWALLPETAHLYGVRGRSRDDAAQSLKAFQNAGLRHFAKVDIVDCYQQVQPEALQQLPLPKEVIRRTLDTRNLTFLPKGTQRVHPQSVLYKNRHSPSAPRGLMQGSPASGVILAWLLQGLPQCESVRVILCFDNIVIAGDEHAKVREMVSTLADWLHRCPAGPLALCPAEYSNCDATEFLGYLFDPKRPDIGIADAPLNRLEGRLARLEEADIANGGIPARTWAALRSFRLGFGAVGDPEKELGVYVAATEEWVEAQEDKQLTDLHRNLFAQTGTDADAKIRAIIAHHQIQTNTR